MRHHGGTTRALAAAAVVGIVLALAACSGSGGAGPTSPPAVTASSTPQVTATPSPTAEPSPTPTAALTDVTVAPTPPAALDGPATEENAAAVAEYFMSLFPYLFATGDSGTWEALSGPSCGYCSGVVDSMRADLAKQRHSEGGAIEVLESGASTFDSADFVTWVTFIEHPSQTVDHAGHVVEDFPDTRHSRATLLLKWDGTGWQVNGVDPSLIEVM